MARWLAIATAAVLASADVSHEDEERYGSLVQEVEPLQPPMDDGALTSDLGMTMAAMYDTLLRNELILSPEDRTALEPRIKKLEEWVSMFQLRYEKREARLALQKKADEAKAKKAEEGKGKDGKDGKTDGKGKDGGKDKGDKKAKDKGSDKKDKSDDKK
eukprot:TRINITY_DN4197_c0_g4_i1.p2 TRINITY_DN4197_c0_g4~~TRINITY_DN4197_c0_g4_i1.p2  ORF type:complete len:159 (+),score=68.82 TRINITY_DN4197_c0_g4_i1:71-547(+)